MGSKVSSMTRRGFQAGRGVVEVVRIGVVTGKGTWYRTVMNRAVASEFSAPVPYLPMFQSISATLLVEICLGYFLLAYSLWYFVIYFGNAL